MNNPILSICIPTYNRAPFLRQCLQSITSQFSDVEIKEKVEVVISDNGSQDSTQSVIEDFQKEFKNIEALRNSENLGVDRNILNVVGKARGEFCWLMGDDDALFADAFHFLLPKLAENKHDYFLANTWGYDRRLQTPALSRPNFHIEQDQAFSSLRELVMKIANYRDIVGYFGGLSGQIFKRSVWQNLPTKESFIGSQVIHLYLILQAFKDLPALIIAKPLVKTRADNMRWETFPGLETVRGRARSTKQTAAWILGLYGIPYSKIGLQLDYYYSVLFSWFILAAKKTIFRSQRVRNLLKKILGK